MDEHLSFKTASVERAYTYWKSKIVGERLPRRQDIRPEELRGILPFVFLIDVEDNPLSFRFRLVGTQLTIWAGQEYTGLGVNEQDYGPHWRRVHDCYVDATVNKKARRDEYFAPWISKEFHYYERLVAPLLSDSGKVEMLYGALHILPPPKKAPGSNRG